MKTFDDYWLEHQLEVEVNIMRTLTNPHFSVGQMQAFVKEKMRESFEAGVDVGSAPDYIR